VNVATAVDGRRSLELAVKMSPNRSRSRCASARSALLRSAGVLPTKRIAPSTKATFPFEGDAAETSMARAVL